MSSDDKTVMSPNAADISFVTAGGAHSLMGPYLCLFSFWLTSLAAWFAMSKGQLILGSISNKLMCYYHVLPCLPESTIDLVADFVKGQLPVDPAEVETSGHPPANRLPEGGADPPASSLWCTEGFRDAD
jgi:hypothetical protein